MTRELVFHLGDRKTGSTSIQTMLREQSWLGGGSTIGYPARLHAGQVAKALAGRLRNAEAKGRIRKLRERLDANQADIAVISSEDFEVVEPEQLADMLAESFAEFRDETRLIAYVRPHADRILSSYSERVKLGLINESLDSFVDGVIQNRRFHYHGRFQNWRSVFGDRFELRPMIRSQLHMNCVVRDFLSFALQSTDFKLLKEPVSNASLTVKDLAILIELHRHLGNAPEEKTSLQSIGRNLGIVLGAQPMLDSPKMAFSHDLSRKVIEAHRRDAALLDKAFFKGAPMSEALEASAANSVDVVASILPEDNFVGNELRMLRALAILAGEMYRINPHAWTQHFSLLRLGVADDIEDVGVVKDVPRAQLAKTGGKKARRPAGKRLGGQPPVRAKRKL